MTKRLRRGAMFARAIHKNFRDFKHRFGKRHAPSLAERAEWLTHAAVRVLTSLGMSVAKHGAVPQHGLIVSNHLSYLDILCFSSVAPCIFVSKSEVQGWPVFGRLATNGGTIYVVRNNRADAARVAKEIEEALRAGVRVVLFPEGTSSGGEAVLPFHAPLLEAAIRAGAPITPASIDYQIEHGDPSQDVCYWGDMTFATHFLSLLGKGKVHAKIRFGHAREKLTDRKMAAKALHADVAELHEQLKKGNRGPSMQVARAEHETHIC